MSNQTSGLVKYILYKQAQFYPGYHPVHHLGYHPGFPAYPPVIVQHKGGGFLRSFSGSALGTAATVIGIYLMQNLLSKIEEAKSKKQETQRGN